MEHFFNRSWLTHGCDTCHSYYMLLYSYYMLLHSYYMRVITRKLLANMSADATHRFQPFQPSSELVEKVAQPNQPKTGFSQ